MGRMVQRGGAGVRFVRGGMKGGRTNQASKCSGGARVSGAPYDADSTTRLEHVEVLPIQNLLRVRQPAQANGTILPEIPMRLGEFCRVACEVAHELALGAYRLIGKGRTRMALRQN